jgi:hypothetical protein
MVGATLALAACASGGKPYATRTPQSGDVVSVTAVGFDGPENLVYDSAADVFLVSNVGGDPAARDGRGFISRVGPDGKMIALRWIASGERGARLDAPKGLALRHDTLFVADVGALRLFDRRSGAALGTIAIPGLVMNDVLPARDGSVWVTDTGPDRSTTPVDTSRDMDAVWRVTPAGHVQAMVRGLALARPDGIAPDDGGVLVSTFGNQRLERVDASRPGQWKVITTLPNGRVDGLRRLGDGSLVITSWDARSVWRRAPDGTLAWLLRDVQSPAGVAVDTRRHRLAVTSMQGNAMYLVPMR